MFAAIVLVLIIKTQLSLQLRDGFCKNNEGDAVCCYNFENVNDMCTKCKIGTVSKPGGRCLPCQQNKYGIKCLDFCDCNNSQRCDPENGCIFKTVSTMDTPHIDYNFTTQKVATTHLIEDTEEYYLITKNVITTHTIKDSTLKTGNSNMEWLIYTLCVVGFLIIIALSHFVRSYRKRLSKNIRREDRGEHIEMRQERVNQPYADIYDEIDENLVGMDNSHPLVIPELRNTRTIINDVQTMKINNDQEDHSSYLDAVFAVNETESQSSLKESSSSHSSNVDLDIPDHTGYLNPYQPLKREHQMSDGYEVAIRVHENSESSSGSLVSDDWSSAYKYSHVYQKLQQDQSTNTHMYEKAIMNANELNHSEKKQTNSSRNKGSAEKEIIDLSDLLFDTEIDRTHIEHVSFDCQTLENYDREQTDTFINADGGDRNNILGNTAKPIQQDHTRTLHDENFIEQVLHEDISNEYLDMQNSTQEDYI